MFQPRLFNQARAGLLDVEFGQGGHAGDASGEICVHNLWQDTIHLSHNHFL